ncbi:MAG: hypothetical protein JRJ87_25315, partial [Deltaproteobacteria bacterium]|nr:hypothetical protein [Deltaproteobacteria bacterium]
IGVFLQDSCKVLKTLTIKPGIRFDYVMINTDMVDKIIELKTTSPRINIAWDATGDGNTVVRAGYNRYVDPAWFNVASFLGVRTFPQETMEYNPATGQYDIVVSRDDPDQQIVVGSDDNTAPHADEFTIEVERELFTDFSLAINALYREYKYSYEDDEVNEIWNQDGTDIIGYKSGDEHYIYRTKNPREAWRRYWGLEFKVRKNFSDNWQLNGSYTYSRSQGIGEGYWTALMDNPRQNEFMWSWSSFDRRHQVKIDGSYHLPYGIELGASIYWRTGMPYSKWFQGYMGSWNHLKTMRGYDPDHPDNDFWNRTPDVMLIDLKVVWDMKELTGQQIDIIARMMNVMHLRYKSDLETNAYPPGGDREYGRYYSMSDGFSAELGVRYRY